MTFEDRGKSFENKYKHDEELKFKTEVRLAKLFGQWVAGELAMAPEAADAYAKEMVAAQLDAPGNDDIIDKAFADFKAAGKELPRHALETKVNQLEPVARDQIMTETK